MCQRSVKIGDPLRIRSIFGMRLSLQCRYYMSHSLFTIQAQVESDVSAINVHEIDSYCALILKSKLDDKSTIHHGCNMLWTIYSQCNRNTTHFRANDTTSNALFFQTATFQSEE
jgi:hypothetical protein